MSTSASGMPTTSQLCRMPRQADVARMLIELGIEFRDRGGEYWARCPNPQHDEKTGSWSINAETGAHHCFGCKWQGGAAELVRKVVGLSGYPASRTWLEEKGLYQDGPVPLEVRLEIVRPDEPVVMVMPKETKFLPLKKWITPAKRYALKRGVTVTQVRRWGLGYATGGYYANRLILPTKSRDGILLNVTGRAWSPTKRPKYLNSKSIHGWDPGAIFGEQHWPLYATRSTIVLCEGELNALALERRGVEFVGALGGSQLEKEQVLKLSQFQRIILATDIDKAGSAIALSLRETLVRWRRCAILEFPDNRDPNDLEREDPELLDRLLKEVL